MATNQKTNQNPIKLCDWPLDQLPGLSQQDRNQLNECGITSTGQLIRKAGTQTNRTALANRLQINIQYVNKWVALANLASLPAVGCQYCGLLLHAGISSVSQLAQTPTHQIHQQILRLQVATMQRRDLCPSVETIQQWIKQAQSI